ncbi:MAG: ABC transporter permease [Alphaproteobacteria bacterium]|nr:ABC transporter permease [Alphaproteobacteria bacterium]
MAQSIEAVTELSRPADRGERLRRFVDTFGPFITVGAILLAWELMARQQIVTPFLLPAMTTVAARIGDDLISGRLLLDVALTLYRAFAGFAIAAVVGVALGLLIARFVTVRWFFDPIVSFALPMPKIALMPIFMLWFGLFDMSKILMVAFSLSFQIVISTWSAAHSVEKELVWSARSLGASDRATLWEVVLPAALPQILTGLQVALPLALIVALVTEMIMGGGGLGDTMLQSARYVDSPGVFAGIVEIGIVGYGCIAAMGLIRKRLLAWHQESSNGGTM